MKQTMIFGIKTEGAKKAQKDIDGVAKSSKKAEDSQEGLNDSIDSGTGALNNMTGGAITAFAGVASGVKKAVLGMRTLKGAMMATGIGALVVLVGSLVAYFTQTKRGAELLQVATAGLGAIFGKITDVLSSLGEVLITAFTSPQKVLDSLLEKGQAVVDWGKDLWTMYLKYVKLVFEGMKVGFIAAAIAAAEFFSLGLADTTGLQKKLQEAKDAVVEAKEELVVAAKVVAEPFVEAFVAAKDAVNNFVKDVSAAVGQASALERRAVALKDAQRELGVEFAQTRETMNELRLVGEDTTKEIGVRIAAIEEAGALEADLAAKSLLLAQEAVDIKRAQNDITESTAEDLQALADLEIALSSAQIESAGKQRALLLKVNALYAEQEANVKALATEEEARIKEIIERQDMIDDIVEAGQARELQKIRAHWKKIREEAKATNDILIGDKEAERIQLEEVNDKYDKIREDKLDAAQQERKDGILETAGAVLDGLSALNEAFTSLSGAETDANAARELAIQEETDEAKKKQLIATNNKILAEQEKQQKKGFENSKKIQIAQALIQTYSSATAAFNSLASIPVVGPILGGLAAAAAVAGGLAQVAMIKKTTFQGGGGGQQEYQAPPTTAEGGGASAAASSTAPQLDLSFLGEGAGGSIQAYVISENVTNQQQADQIVTDQTTL
tara:strand:+ start:2692 stop:4713 length:2022 start_codon:yes stop_codon:yes gene_type:complete